MRAILLLALLTACGDNERTVSCTDAPATCRMTCGYGAGDHARDTLADLAPKTIPLDTIVLVMQENRTFDHYFSQLTMPGQTLDVAAPDTTQPDPTTPGATVSRFHQTAYCFDNPAESWDEVHREIDGGAMDGFTAQNAQADDPQGLRTLGYYDATDIPYYYALAQNFAISDRHFASAQANTWTNRTYYMAGTSFGITTNTFPPANDADGNPLPDLFTRLNDAKITWSFYAQDVPSLAILFGTYAKNLGHVNPYEQYFTDAAAGKLAQVVFVEGSDQKGGVSPDEDPPGDMQVGQQMVHDVIAALVASPHWAKSAVFLSFDEQGGLYDHVPPQSACVPDDYQPQLQPGDVQAAFDQTGLRVPLMVISPYAKRGYVSHVVTDHTSILRFLEARFDLPALTHRDANAVPPFDMFDFDSPPDTSFPTLPDAAIDATQQQACAAKYPPMT